MIPSPVETQLKAIFERDQSADCVAIVWPEEVANNGLVNVSGHDVKVTYCVSELAMREALVNHDHKSKLVLLSKFDEVHLAKDVIARLWKNEPQRISPWKTLQQLVKVREIDPRLSKQQGRWMADALLSCFDKYQNKVSFGEVLDVDSAWKALAVGFLDYQEKAFDLDALFNWSIKSDVSALVENLPDDVKTNISDWLRIISPKNAELIEHILLAGHGNDLLAVVMTSSILYEQNISQLGLVEPSKLYSSQGRFVERYLDGKNVKAEVYQSIGREAQRTFWALVKRDGLSVLDRVGGKAEQILASLDLMPLCAVSTLLPHGYVLRVENFAGALDSALGGDDLKDAEKAFELVKKHAQASFDKSKEQIHNAEMALRLVRWIKSSRQSNGSVNDDLSDYILNGSFVDWARSSIWSGDMNETLTNVFLKVSNAITEKRQAQNKSFTQHLPGLARGDALGSGYIPVENTLEQLVAQLASHEPVLLLVLDGMSQAVYRELTEDILKHNWVELSRADVKQDACLITAFPTITQVSRCSLLSGDLSSGDSNVEKAAFKSHPTLKKIASTKFPPELFHKKDIQQPGSGALDGNVREKLAGTQHRVLGLVINAIDDQLKSSSQVSVDWALDSVSLLGHVLEAAREAGRVVIVTSDHGHVLDHDSFYQQSQSERGERYQQSSASLTDNEVEVKGDRVVTDTHSVVMPWSEQLRYTKSKSMGYHGGASLQEIVIPLGIFANASDCPEIEGWIETPKYTPSWWDTEDSVGAVEPKVTIKQSSKPKKPAVADKIDDMFGEPEPEATESVETDLADRLLQSAVYMQQLQTAGRTNIKEAQVKGFISLMLKSQGQAMESVVCKELSIPKIRLRGFLAGLQKTLNVDGYPIVSVNRETQTIKLNIQDFKKQFEL